MQAHADAIFCMKQTLGLVMYVPACPMLAAGMDAARHFGQLYGFNCLNSAMNNEGELRDRNATGLGNRALGLTTRHIFEEQMAK